MTIHREGGQTIIIVFVALLFLNLTMLRMAGPIAFYVVLAASIIFLLLILQFFRYPNRKVPEEHKDSFVSPADGKVVVIEDAVESEYFEDERLMISIFMSPLNVHSNHHPISGSISYSKYHPGKYLVAWHPKSSTENERFTTVYKKGEGEFLVRQIAGAVARRICNYVTTGDEVIQGGEMGFIKFGSRVDMFFPVGTKYKVTLGQKVKAKIDVIAEI